MPRKSKKKYQTYAELFAALPDKQQQKVNVAMAKAVTNVSDLSGRAIPGTKLFLEARGRQLIRDAKYLGWGQAANRFRSATAQWAKTHQQELADG